MLDAGLVRSKEGCQARGVGTYFPGSIDSGTLELKESRLSSQLHTLSRIESLNPLCGLLVIA